MLLSVIALPPPCSLSRLGRRIVWHLEHAHRVAAALGLPGRYSPAPLAAYIVSSVRAIWSACANSQWGTCVPARSILGRMGQLLAPRPVMSYILDWVRDWRTILRDVGGVKHIGGIANQDAPGPNFYHLTRRAGRAVSVVDLCSGVVVPAVALRPPCPPPDLPAWVAGNVEDVDLADASPMDVMCMSKQHMASASLSQPAWRLLPAGAATSLGSPGQPALASRCRCCRLSSPRCRRRRPVVARCVPRVAAIAPLSPSLSLSTPRPSDRLPAGRSQAICNGCSSSPKKKGSLAS